MKSDRAVITLYCSIHIVVKRAPSRENFSNHRLYCLFFNYLAGKKIKDFIPFSFGFFTLSTIAKNCKKENVYSLSTHNKQLKTNLQFC